MLGYETIGGVRFRERAESRQGVFAIGRDWRGPCCTFPNLVCATVAGEVSHMLILLHWELASAMRCHCLVDLEIRDFPEYLPFLRWT
jgi:hypothetical protein